MISFPTAPMRLSDSQAQASLLPAAIPGAVDSPSNTRLADIRLAAATADLEPAPADPAPATVGSRHKTFMRRSFLPLRPFPLWQIQTGLVRSYTLLENGNIVTLGLWGSGDLVGTVFSRNQSYMVECLTTVEATPLPASTLSNCTEALLAQIHQMHDLMEILHSRPVEVAFIGLLNWLAYKFGETAADGQRITIPLTHQIMADMIGSSRVTITRLLNQFEEEQIIQRLPKRVILLQEQQPDWYYQI